MPLRPVPGHEEGHLQARRLLQGTSTCFTTCLELGIHLADENDYAGTLIGASRYLYLLWPCIRATASFSIFLESGSHLVSG